MIGELDLGLARRTRVQPVRQNGVTECGLACLVMVARFHRRDVDLAMLRRRHPPSLRGVTFRELMAIADELHLTTRALRLPVEMLEELVLPAILHWNMSHFVVIERVRRGEALLHDPAGKSKWLPLAELVRHFNGMVLEIEPIHGFDTSPPRRERLRVHQLWRHASGLRRAVAQTIALSLVMQAFTLASPYYMQIALDSAAPALDHDLLTVLALGFGLLTLVNCGAQLLRAFVLLAAGTSLGFGIASNLARHLFRLPLSWFEHRHTGDILARFQSVLPIRHFLSEGAVATLLDGSLALATLAMMSFYSLTLTLLALVAFAAYAIVRFVTFSAQRAAQNENIATTAEEQSALIETVRSIATLRLYNREAARHAVWRDKLLQSMNANAALGRVNAWQALANSLIFGLEMILCVWIGIGLVITGGFTPGMIFAFIAYKTQFLQRGSSFIDQVVAIRMLGLHLERLADIALESEDPRFAMPQPTSRALVGAVELRDVSFSYRPGDPPVLDGLNLRVEPGEHVAITGPSGGGKSTLLKVMLGLYCPSAGKVAIDGTEIARFGLRNLHEQIGVVLQDDQIFAGSLTENIALFDDMPDFARIEEAARCAVLLDDIAAMPMGFETAVGELGSALSGGQRQRLLLARALYRRPRLLVMDEGTSHLDSDLERQVNEAVSRLGITRIVVAHRAETIACADRILALNHGRLDPVEHPRPALRGVVA